METGFVRRDPCYDRVLFVLTLDRKKIKERILIGEELQARFRLQGDKKGCKRKNSQPERIYGLAISAE